MINRSKKSFLLSNEWAIIMRFFLFISISSWGTHCSSFFTEPIACRWRWTVEFAERVLLLFLLLLSSDSALPLASSVRHWYWSLYRCHACLQGCNRPIETWRINFGQYGCWLTPHQTASVFDVPILLVIRPNESHEVKLPRKPFSAWFGLTG